MSTVSLLESSEYHYMKATNNNNLRYPVNPYRAFPPVLLHNRLSQWERKFPLFYKPLIATNFTYRFVTAFFQPHPRLGMLHVSENFQPQPRLGMLHISENFQPQLQLGMLHISENFQPHPRLGMLHYTSLKTAKHSPDWVCYTTHL